MSNAIDTDEPITLAEACQLYPRAKLTVHTLRAEAARGRLDVFKIGRRQYTTPAAMREMVEKCRVAERRSVSTYTRPSETVSDSSAQTALRENVERLKRSSRNT